MNKRIYLIILLLAFRICDAQNLVPNGSFEQYSGCPDTYSQFDSCLFWLNPANGGGTGGSPDFYNQCASNNIVGVPVNTVGTSFQFAHSGGAYCGGFIWSGMTPNVREYIEVPLTSTLVANQCYHFEMYVNLNDRCKFSTHDIGVYFSDTIVTGFTNYYPLPFAPQINNDSGNFFDTLNWTLVSQNYIAQGGEGFLIIGNFKDDSITSSFVINPVGPSNYTYVFIDDVSLTSCTGMNTEEQSENSGIKIYPNPAGNKLNCIVTDSELSEIILYDLASRKIIHKQFTNAVSLNTAQLAKGIYLYEVRNKNGVIKKGKVVKD